MTQDNRLMRVSASFVSRYYTLLMEEPQQLVPMYVPRAQFQHDGSARLVHGPEAISQALTRLYPEGHHGRVTIESLSVKPTERSRFAIVVRGTYFRKGRSDGEAFHQVLELQEHSGSNGIFGIFADTRNEVKQEPLQWALETPPMDAKPAPTQPMPALSQPPASESVAVAAPEPPKVVEAAAAPVEVERAPLSFADILRTKPTPKPKVEKGKENGEKRSEKKERGEAKGKSEAKPNANAAQRQTPAKRFDVIVKGLPTSANRKSVTEMFTAAVAKVQLKSHPDLKDATVTRTFAFVLLDHDALTAAGADVQATIVEAVQSINAKHGSEKIVAEQVREKPTAATEKREKKEKAAPAKVQ